MKLKRLDEQVIVITGASSGIGLTTARMAAKKGARVVLAARDEESLQRAVSDIRDEGGEAVYVVADVSEMDEVRDVAAAALREYGGFDTWVNDAGVSIYGTIDNIPLEDARRLFEVNFWGVVYGSLIAVEHLRERGGVLINIGSVASVRALPVQGYYSASKQAVKGFTDALRMELQKEGAPIAVSLIKPSGIATPFGEHAKNYMEGAEPNLPPPVYAPEVVARTILHCAQKPAREITVGAGGRVLTAIGDLMPRTMDRVMESVIWEQQKWRREDGDGHESALYEPISGSGRQYGEVPRHIWRTSMYTRAILHPGMMLLGIAAVGLGIALGSYLRS